MVKAVSETNEKRPNKCAICFGPLDEFYKDYSGAVCNECDDRALNNDGNPARHIRDIEKTTDAILFDDDGDNPVFIDGIKCLRRYRFGGWVTMKILGPKATR